MRDSILILLEKPELMRRLDIVLTYLADCSGISEEEVVERIKKILGVEGSKIELISERFRKKA